MTKSTVEILGVRVHPITGTEMLNEMRTAIAEKRQRIFAYVNAHAINIARQDPGFRDFLNTAEVAYPDGEGVRLAARMLGKALPRPTALTRWLWEIAQMCEEQGHSIFLLGSTEEHVAEAARQIRARFPRLTITYHHGYFSSTENAQVVDAINSSQPQVLLVGFGMPKQEEWIARHRTKISACVILPAGSAIDFAAGVHPVSPLWMSRIGMEWLFRLALEPRRLFKRYAIGNVSFLAAVVREKLSHF